MTIFNIVIATECVRDYAAFLVCFPWSLWLGSINTAVILLGVSKACLFLHCSPPPLLLPEFDAPLQSLDCSFFNSTNNPDPLQGGAVYLLRLKIFPSALWDMPAYE